MKTIFDKTTKEELIRRTNLLKENSKAKWGKMNVSQMVKHCILWDKMALGKTKHKQVFIGRLFGKMALRSMLKDEKTRRNIGTLPELIVTETGGDIGLLKKQWIASLEEYAQLKDDHIFIHSFFGKLNKEQTGLSAYKHTDHHLRQFEV